MCVTDAIKNFQELQKEADNPLNCPRAERARKGDRVLIRYKGKLWWRTVKYRCIRQISYLSNFLH